MFLKFWLPLIAIFVAITVLGWVRARWRDTREHFYVKDRTVGLTLGATVVFATWMQAPAILGAGFYAYKSTEEFAALWFWNVFGLLVIAPFVVPSIRKMVKKGYTGAQYGGAVYGPWVRSDMFMVQLASMVGATSLVLTGVSQWLAPLVGVDERLLMVVMAAVALVWVIVPGFQGGVTADCFKAVGIVALAAGVGWLCWRARGDVTADTFVPSKVLATVDPLSTTIMLGISLSTAVLLNPDICERGFAIVADRKTQRRVYFVAGVAFGLCAFMFGAIGMLAAHVFHEPFAGFPAFAVLKRYAPEAVVIAVSLCLSVVFVGSLASFIASNGNVLSVEVYQRFREWRTSAPVTDMQSVSVSRITMPVSAVFSVIAGLFLAAQPGTTIGGILEALGVWRGGVLFLTVVSPLLLARGIDTRRYDVPLGVAYWVGLAGGLYLMLNSFFGADFRLLGINGRALGALFAFFVPMVVFVLTFVVFHFTNANRLRMTSQTQ